MSMERIALALTIGFGAFKAIKEFLKLSNEEHEFSAIAGPPGGRQNRKEFFGLGVSEFLNDDRLLIAYRSWIPQSITKGVVIISHGFAGHSGRYEHVALELQRNGFAVYGIDHVGHGQSEGDRAYVKHFSNYSRDLIQLTRMVKNVHEDQTNFFLIGHSMGGAIAIKTIFQEPKLFNAVVLSGPLIEPDPKVATPVMKTLARLVSNLVPKMSLDSVEADKVSEDPIVVNRYVNDPLVYHGGIRARPAAEILEFLENEIPNKVKDWKVPLLLQHGTKDELCIPEASKRFFSMMTSDKKHRKLVMYDGLYHEIYNSPFGRDKKTMVNKPIRDAVDWLLSYC